MVVDLFFSRGNELVKVICDKKKSYNHRKK
jgi:hypothetical protein